MLGRQTSDSVTTLGSGVDGAVRRIDTAYDTQGNAYLLTSYADTGGTTIANQVQRSFNGLAQLTQEWQSHSGAVNTSTTPSVQYGWSLMANGANHSRLTSITYPNGKVLNYNYNSGVDDSISRLSYLSDTSGTLESYSYLGLNTVVKRAHPLPTNGLDLTYIGTGTGDAGDQYTGLDRFGRVVEQKWQTEQSTPTVTDDFTYGYDRDSNRLYRNNLLNTAFGELYHANGSGNGYDNLNQLVNFERGTLNSSHDTITSPSHTITWSLDALGNFNSTTTDGGNPVNNTFNKQNEETAAGTANLTFDNNGNTTTDDQGKNLVYDAWNRLVAYKNGSTTLESYKYDALNRRIVENPGTVHDLYYDASWRLLEERWAGVSTATIQYVWSRVYIDALILRDRSTQNNGTLDERLWVQQDANWNVTALVNGSGSVIERYVFDPFGKVTFLNSGWVTLGTSAYAWVYLHQCGRYDVTSGLYCFRRRDLSSQLGHWLETDPILLHRAQHDLYLYESDCPVSRKDPSGLVDHHWFPQGAQAGCQDAVDCLCKGDLHFSIHEFTTTFPNAPGRPFQKPWPHWFVQKLQDSFMPFACQHASTCCQLLSAGLINLYTTWLLMSLVYDVDFNLHPVHQPPWPSTLPRLWALWRKACRPKGVPQAPIPLPQPLPIFDPIPKIIPIPNDPAAPDHSAALEPGPKPEEPPWWIRPILRPILEAPIFIIPKFFLPPDPNDPSDWIA